MRLPTPCTECYGYFLGRPRRPCSLAGVLLEDTGQCVACSRFCDQCGHLVRSAGNRLCTGTAPAGPSGSRPNSSAGAAARRVICGRAPAGAGHARARFRPGSHRGCRELDSSAPLRAQQCRDRPRPLAVVGARERQTVRRHPAELTRPGPLSFGYAYGDLQDRNRLSGTGPGGLALVDLAGSAARRGLRGPLPRPALCVRPRWHERHPRRRSRP
jgi:hypothetical protein